MKRFLGFFRNDMLLKISALVFAVIMWSYVITATDPYREKKIDQVPITYDSQQLNSSLLLSSNSLDAFQNVEVVVDVRMSESNKATRNNITIEADLSQISSAGEYEIELKARSSSNSINVKEIRPSTIKVEVDDKVERVMVVSVETTGDMAEGLINEPPTASSSITIYGPRADLDRASRAVCTVDLSNVDDDIVNQNRSVKIFDEDGDEIPRIVFVDRPPSVNINMVVLHTKTVKVNYSLASLKNLNTWPNGYGVEDIKLTQDEVVIAAQPEVLEDIDSLDIEPIDLEGFNLEHPGLPLVELLLPEGVKLAEEVDVKAILTIMYPEDEDEPQGTGGITLGGR